jgi:type VI secretion system protein ImpH
MHRFRKRSWPDCIPARRCGWRPFERSQRTLLDDESAAGFAHGQLGRGAALGDEAWDPQASVRIRLGPMERSRYEEFLPGGPAFVALRQMVDYFARGGFDYQINPILCREDVPAIQLGESLESESSQYQATKVRLGWTTWLSSRPLDRDADETVLSRWQTAALEKEHESARIGHQAGPGSPEGDGGGSGSLREPDAL